MIVWLIVMDYTNKCIRSVFKALQMTGITPSAADNKGGKYIYFFVCRNSTWHTFLTQVGFIYYCCLCEDQ